MIVIGVDPGGRWTGLVVRDLALAGHDQLVALQVYERPRGAGRAVPGADYLTAVLEWIASWFVDGAMVAIEEATAPTGFRDGERAPITPGSLIGLGAVYGAVVGRYPNTVVVPPGGLGQGPLRAYPPALVGSRETTGSGGRLRHARSAWDVAGAARSISRRGRFRG